MQRQLALPTLIVALACACRSAGSGPTRPVETYRLVHPAPCMTVQPIDPGPILRHAPMCEASADGEVFCPPLSDETIAALWTYVEALEDVAWSAWRCAERQRARYEVSPAPRGDGQGADAGAP